MTPPAGNIRSSRDGGLRVTIDGVEHLVDRLDTHNLLRQGCIASLVDPHPAPLLIGESLRVTGHIISSRPGADETPHLLICVYPDRRYLALTHEAAAVWEEQLDICKVVAREEWP